MNILLLGSEGFIASHVYDKLKALGHTVVGLDNLEPRVHGDNPTPKRTHIICDYGQTPYSILSQADVVINLAAQVSVADSMVNLLRYRDHNSTQMYDFINSLRMVVHNGHHIRRLVVASSSSIYGNVPLPMVEDSPVRPNNVYGLTKFDQEMLTRMWGQALDIEAVALRFFNVYGPGAAMHNVHTGVLANFANMQLRGEQPTMTEDGRQVRDFIHVEDIANAIVRAATWHEPLPYDVYNVCTGMATSMASATKQLAQAMDLDIEPRITGEYRQGDQQNVLGSSYRTLLLLGKHPTPFREGVKEYGAWLKTQIG